MRIAPRHLLLLPLVASVQVVCAQDTAYQALRTFGASHDQALLNRVIEVKGRGGSPQPNAWLLVIDDPKARGGVREVEIQGGRVASERTPVQAYSGNSADSIMDMSRLNLDSQGAYTVAEDEARAAGFTFSQVDYVLRRDENSGSPLWVLQLLDRSQHGVGTIRISADNGSVVSKDFKQGSRAAASTAASTPSPQRSSSRRESPSSSSSYSSSQSSSSSSRSSSSRASSNSRNAYHEDIPVRSATGRAPRPPAPAQANDRRDVRKRARREQEERYQPPAESRGHYRDSDETVYDDGGNDRARRKDGDIGYRINRRVHRMGGALQHFFTGKRTVDDDYRESYDRVD